MSIELKRGQAALTRHYQKRHQRTLLTKRRWKAWRTFVHAVDSRERTPMERAFKGIAGREYAVLADRRAHRVLRPD